MNNDIMRIGIQALLLFLLIAFIASVILASTGVTFAPLIILATLLGICSLIFLQLDRFPTFAYGVIIFLFVAVLITSVILASKGVTFVPLILLAIFAVFVSLYLSLMYGLFSREFLRNGPFRRLS